MERVAAGRIQRWSAAPHARPLRGTRRIDNLDSFLRAI
jgi:hypothetical protein